MRFRYAAPKGSSLCLPFHIFPGRVAKQILAMFASSCGPGLFAASDDLRRYVLNRDHTGIPPRYRLYAYLMAPRSKSSRQSGVAGLLTGPLERPFAKMHVFAEVAFPPFGYILSINTPPVQNELADLTDFTSIGFRDFRSLHIRLPVREVNSYFPADFRTVEEWERDLDAAHGPQVSTTHQEGEQ